MQVVWTCTGYGNEERIDSNGRWKRFCEFKRNGWNILQWFELWLRSLVHRFWFHDLGCFGNRSFVFDEGGIENDEFINFDCRYSNRSHVSSNG